MLLQYGHKVTAFLSVLTLACCVASSEGKVSESEVKSDALRDTKTCLEILHSVPNEPLITTGGFDTLIHEEQRPMLEQLRERIEGRWAGKSLEKCDFSGQDLENEDFMGANLNGAHFESAYLVGAYFTFADASYARFDRAALSGARFYNTKLDSANFCRAHAPNSVFVNSNLPEVRT